MKISVITATYNSAKTIPEIIECIQQQSFPDIEWIVVDGKSSDNSVEILKKSNRLSRLISETDRGIYDALNKGIQMATGDVIGFLHSDDLFASSKTLDLIAHEFSVSENGKNNKIPDVVYGDLVFTALQDTNKIVRYWKSKTFKPSLLFRGWMPPHPTLFMRREVYGKHGFFNTNLRCASDYDYIIRVFQDETLEKRYIPKVITKMRMGGTSTGGIKKIINKKREDYWVLRKNNMPFPFWILMAKNFSKIHQLILK
ncbi:MAG TPA: glycosyltransferase family 2 protein [Prolixibacteraceae bacterium]|nr:glycosyltransferase family 2 protein [Prolixibacteraceae bacterium]